MKVYLTAIFCLFFAQIINAKPLEIELGAKSAILINNENGRVLFAKNPDEKIYPASITKIATALYVLDQKSQDLGKVCIASSDALATVSPQKKCRDNFEAFPAYYLESGGSNIEIKREEKMSLMSLIYGMMISSGNDAANVIADSVGPSIPTFIEGLNAYLLTLGCKNTHFCNPHGLHHPDHVTTASDLAIMTRKALQVPLFQKVVSSTHFTRPTTNKHEPKELYQTNRLLKKGAYYYPYAMGVKTGFTSQAGHNLVASAAKNGRSLTAVLIGYETSKERFKDAKRLFETAFNEKKISQKLLGLEKRFAIDLSGAAKRVTAYLQSDFVLQMYPSEETSYKVFIHWEDLSLPIAKDKLVGHIEALSEAGEILQSMPIYAENSVDKSLLLRLKEFLFRF